ncbi:cation/H(+) antiporter 6A [Eutrema salsugineum]|uniref:cation/H(+) antiporter 6A n=1 Tax=Eutrema salsugineum TaxID=72664 RepID=UPI000CED5FF2|nr:cation/H(+) antiporter 6A [Eutrema salsugineum]
MNQHVDMSYWDVAWRGYKEDNNASLFCETHPSILNSHGVWERLSYKSRGMSFWEYPLPNLEIILFSTYVIWRLLDLACNKIRLRVPRFTYMMIAGVILGQTCHLNNNSWLRNIFFPDDKRPKVAETVGAFGFLIYWFLKGVTMDAAMGFRMGKKTGVIAFTTSFVPLILGNLFFRLRMRRGTTSLLRTEYRLIVFLQSISAFTSIDTLLKDIKIKHSEFGRIALSAAMVTDMLAFLLTFLNAMHWEGYKGLIQTIGACLFFAFMVYAVRPALFWVIKHTPEGRPVKDSYIYFILALAFFSFQYFHYIHLYGAAGSFVLGLAVPDGYPLGAALVQKFESFNLGAILPLFGSLSMMQLDLSWLLKECGNLVRMEGKLYEVVSFLFFVNTTKLIASTIAAFALKMPLSDSFALALVLSNKGIFELSYFTYAVEMKVVTPEVFTIIATFILLNSIFIPMALELVHDPTKRFKCYQKRNLVILKDGAELQSLVCIYKPDHITSMIDLLGAFNPSKDSPTVCNILHLIELVGQASPVFISHQLQQPEPGSTSCSDNVISSFRRFHKQFLEYTSMDIFTSVSMSKHMHEDICWLALSRSLSLILLPFHRTWSVDRSTVTSNDDKLRMININVLRRAPCSVGIFIYRKPIVESHMTGYSSKICLIFNGGMDDGEALAIANRMRLAGKRISLTIVRFIPTFFDQMESQEFEETFEMANLKETVTSILGSNVKENDDYVTYIDRAVSDGSETSKILRGMANDYDLFIVGRSSGIDTEATSGISEWTEFDELGPIGDLLASHEFPSRASVLVVQKQEYVYHSKSQKRISLST